MPTRLDDAAPDASQRGTSSPPALLAAFVLFTLIVAFFGGSSRYDAKQLILLQPAACLAAGFAFFHLVRGSLSALKILLVLLGALAFLMLLQLIPLPQAVWHALPGREPVALVDAALGRVQARPLSLVPWRTVNALANLGVLLAGLIFVSALGRRAPRTIIAAIVLLGVLNALLGLFQLLAGRDSMLYWYQFTNRGAAVGLFANRNHAAVFAALVMVVIAAAHSARRGASVRRNETLLLWSAYTLIFLIALVVGSRAGLIALLVALSATAIILLSPGRQPRATSTRAFPFRALAALFAATALLTVSMFLAVERLPAFDRFVAENPLGDLRFVITPTLLGMIPDYFPAGTGLGSFQDVYLLHEDSRYLMPPYLNNAHNDWLQFLIEAGAPGAILLLALLAWLHSLIRRLYRLGPEGRPLAVAACAAILIVGMASYVDYPLRTPLFQLVCVWLLSCAALSVAARSKKQGSPV